MKPTDTTASAVAAARGQGGSIHGETVIISEIEDAGPPQPPAEQVRAALAALNEGAMLIEGYEDALVGIVRRKGIKAIGLYDEDMVLEIIADKYDLDDDAALAWFEEHVLSRWAGAGTPAFATFADIDDGEE